VPAVKLPGFQVFAFFLTRQHRAPLASQAAKGMEPATSALFTLTLFTFVFVVVLTPSPYYYRPRYEYYYYECPPPRRAYPAY